MFCEVNSDKGEVQMIAKCSICHSAVIEKFKKVQSPYIDEKYTLYFCRCCDSYFFDSKEFNVDLEKFYNHERFSWNEDFKISNYWARQVKRITNSSIIINIFSIYYKKR